MLLEWIEIAPEGTTQELGLMSCSVSSTRGVIRMIKSYDLGDDSYMGTQRVEIQIGSQYPVEVNLSLGENASKECEGQRAL